MSFYVPYNEFKFKNFVINNFPMADESEATIGKSNNPLNSTLMAKLVKVANVPTVEKSRRGRARAPAAERAARKRNSNKESSRRYRQKIKSRQNDLLSSLDQLTEVWPPTFYNLSNKLLFRKSVPLKWIWQRRRPSTVFLWINFARNLDP